MTGWRRCWGGPRASGCMDLHIAPHSSSAPCFWLKLLHQVLHHGAPGWHWARETGLRWHRGQLRDGGDVGAGHAGNGIRRRMEDVPRCRRGVSGMESQRMLRPLRRGACSGGGLGRSRERSTPSPSEMNKQGWGLPWRPMDESTVSHVTVWHEDN